MEPFVSVIIPYYKGERFIAETIASLCAQEYPNMEVIVVSDGSPAESLGALRPCMEKIRFIEQDNRGQAAARNRGIQAARGSVIGFIDQDDIWPAGRLRATLAALDDAHDFVRGYTIAFEVFPDGTRAASDSLSLPVLLGSALFKRSVFDRVGLFNESMREGDDFDWNVRLNESGLPGAHIETVTLFYRKHGQNHSLTEDFVRKGLFATLKNKLDRKKSAPETP